MLIVLSPAKTLDWTSSLPTEEYTTPDHLKQAESLIKTLRKFSEKKLGELMKISDSLATLNKERYESFSTPFDLDNARQALFSFKGDSYVGFQLEEYDEEDFAYAQDHLRILSGLFGILRPLDLIQPYRLEMGTALKTRRGKNLYEYWDDTVRKKLVRALKAQGDDILINLASNEYFKVLQPKELSCRLIQPVFKDEKKGQYKMIAFYAKRMRGTMSDWILRNRIEDLEKLKAFNEEGYYYVPEESDDTTWVYHRDEQG